MNTMYDEFTTSYVTYILLHTIKQTKGLINKTRLITIVFIKYKNSRKEFSS